MKPLISIIIPAYNVEKYIKQCIESINKQTFKDYEVIIVDDGSTDNTVDIIKKFCTDQYKMIAQENSGAASARNIGIKASLGEYITFMDADDFFYNENCLEKIKNFLKKNPCDVLTYKMIRYYQKNNQYLIEDNITKKDKIYDNIIQYLKTTVKSSKLSISPCDKIIKSEIIKKNQIYFESMEMLEDIDWSFKLYYYVNKIAVYNEPIYVYRKQRVDSTTYFYTPKKIKACYEFLIHWSEECKKKTNEINTIYLHYVAYQYTILIAAINSRNNIDNIIKKLKDFSWLLNYDLNFKVKKAKRVYKIFGYRGMVIILKSYMYLKNKNLILIK